MVPPDSPLIALAQQGVEAAGNIAAVAPTVRNPGSNQSNDQTERARSEAAASASGNRRLVDKDARRQITQNRQQREYGHDCDDLCNIIDDKRHLQGRSLTPSWRSLEQDATPSGRGGFHALAPSLRRSFGLTSSSLGRLINMTVPATLKNSSRSTTRSLRPQEATIG
jgi:hypothetical protein